MGEFMIYFPITLSVVLGSSLFVAIFFNSVMVSQFMSIEDKDMSRKNIMTITGILILFGLLIIVVGGPYRIFGSIMVTTAIMLWVYRLWLRKLAKYFQSNILSKWEVLYEKTLVSALSGWRPYAITISTILLLIIAFGGFGVSVVTQRTKVEFFPDNTPNQIVVYIEYPQGTDIEKTNKITLEIEELVYSFLDANEYKDG